MKIVSSDTRAACCMLWVTMTIVYRWASSRASCSICRVAIGSSAEHGSSMRITSGFTASARAMHRRCCWPPESDAPDLPQAVLDLVPQRRVAQAALDELVALGSSLDEAIEARRRRDVVVDRHGRERVRLLEDHADRAPNRRRLDIPGVQVDVVEEDLALDPRPGTTSSIRFSARSTVDFPLPDGPMMAVTERCAASKVTLVTASLAP